MKKNNCFLWEWKIPGLKKVLITMKLIVFFLLVSVISVFANKTYSQTKTLNLRMKNSTVKEVLRNIEEQSEFHFMYSEKLVDVKRVVSVDVKNKEIDDVLDQLFENTDVKHTVKDRFILLTSNRVINVQQGNAISGKVSDESGDPLPGVTVVVKGTTTGTITNIDGEYSISDVPEGAILQFSFIGMLSQEIEVASRKTIDVTLMTEAIGLDEVVAIGYGTQKKSDLTGSLSSVSSADLNEVPLARIDQGLQGRATGVQVTKTDGSPGGTVKIRIRGANSISGDNSPLVVIDGFLGGSIDNINPSDIQSVEILKDASATAVYGSRGANGVILITTKTGKKGKTKVEYSNFFSIQKLRKKIDVLSAEDLAFIKNEESVALGGNPVFTEAEIAEIKAHGGTDWQDELFRTAWQQNHNLSLSGGSENTNYMFSLNYVDQEGIIINSEYKRYQMRANVDTKINDKFKMGMRFYGIREHSKPQAFNSFAGTPVTDALRFPSTFLSVYDEEGNYIQANDPQLWNPVASANSLITDNYVNTFNANSFLDYNIINGLVFRVSGGVEIVNTDNNSFMSIDNRNAVQVGGRITLLNSEKLSWINTNNLTYTKDIRSNDKLTVTMVYEQQYNKFTRSIVNAQDFVTDVLDYNGVVLANTVQKPTAVENERVIQSLLGRANYSLNDKLLFTVTGRYDGSSVLASGNKWSFFPSTAVAYRLGEEEFLSDFEALHDLKLRASYGVTGSQSIAPYSSFSSLRLGEDYAIDGKTPAVGIGIERYGNEDLGWERTSQIDFGIDVKFFEGRLSFASDYYEKTTTDLLLSVPVPFYTGLPAGSNPPTLLKNVGELKNNGFELYVGAVPVDNANFSWDLGLNLSTNKTKVIDLGEEDFIYGGQFGGSSQPPLYVIREGQSLGDMHGLVFEGVWKSNEVDKAATFGNVPGDSKYKDVNQDGVINEEDRTVIGNGTPELTWSFISNLTYKNFDLNLFFNAAHGFDIYNYTKALMIDIGVTNHPDLLNRWAPGNENTDVPAFSMTDTRRSNISRYVEDGSYIRLKNVTLGYNLPDALVNRLRLQNVRLYVSGQNLWTLTDYTGYDPEINSAGNSDRDLGLDLGGYPPSKTFTFGVDIKF